MLLYYALICIFAAPIGYIRRKASYASGGGKGAWR
jgi:hypothetical protein